MRLCHSTPPLHSNIHLYRATLVDWFAGTRVIVGKQLADVANIASLFRKLRNTTLGTLVPQLAADTRATSQYRDQ